MSTKAYCYCCSKKVEYLPLPKVKDLHERLSPGEEVPQGECLECGALAYHTDEGRRVQKAQNILQRDYLYDVNGVIESITNAVKTKEIESMDSLYERLHEECDGAGRVIYTRQAKLALAFSDNCDAYEEEMGGDMPEWSALAYYAFYRDVQDRLEVRECEECGEALVVDGGDCSTCLVKEDE